MTLFLAAVCAIVAAAILLPPSRRSRMRRQLTRHLNHLDARAGRRPSGTGYRGFVPSVLDTTERVLGGSGIWARTERMLQGTDLQVSAAAFVWLALGCGLLVGLVVSLFGPTWVSVVAGVLGTWIPYSVVKTKIKRRRSQFDQQLPDVLESIAAILRAGHAFTHALKSIADDYTPPVSTEFQRAIAQISVGLPVDEALDEMVVRVESPDLKYVATCVAVQRQAGGSLADFFALVATSVRERQEYARRVKALTAQGRLTAKILLCVPFAVILLLGSSHWQYMRPLFTTGTGNVIIAICVVLMIIGFLTIRRVTRLEV